MTDVMSTLSLLGNAIDVAVDGLVRTVTHALLT